MTTFSEPTVFGLAPDRDARIAELLEQRDRWIADGFPGASTWSYFAPNAANELERLEREAVSDAIPVRERYGIDGTDSDGEWSETGRLAPFVVFDAVEDVVASQEFATRDEAERHKAMLERRGSLVAERVGQVDALMSDLGLPSYSELVAQLRKELEAAPERMETFALVERLREVVTES